jgi:hypothetical protein
MRGRLGSHSYPQTTVLNLDCCVIALGVGEHTMFFVSSMWHWLLLTTEQILEMFFHLQMVKHMRTWDVYQIVLESQSLLAWVMLYCTLCKCDIYIILSVRSGDLITRNFPFLFDMQKNEPISDCELIVYWK